MRNEVRCWTRLFNSHFGINFNPVECSVTELWPSANARNFREFLEMSWILIYFNYFLKNVQTDLFYEPKPFIGLSIVKWNQETLELTMVSLTYSKNRHLWYFQNCQKLAFFSKNSKCHKSKSLQGISMRFSDFFIVWYPPFNEVNFKMIIW